MKESNTSTNLSKIFTTFLIQNFIIFIIFSTKCIIRCVSHFPRCFIGFQFSTQYFLFHSHYAIFLSSYVTINILFFILQKYFKNYLLKMTVSSNSFLSKYYSKNCHSQTRLCKFCFFTRFPELGILCFINIMVTIEIYESSDIRRDYFHTASPPKKIL
jgi:hypothetical protein